MTTSPKVQSRGSGLDGLKWLIVVVLIGAGIVGNAYYGDQSLLYRVLGLVAVTAMAAGVALQTARGRAFWVLLREARTEIRKVVWPTRQETTQTTMVVIALVMLVALILWGLDSLLGWIISSVIG